MAKYTIQIYADNCTGCRRCQLACSETTTRHFNPVKANIRVEVSGVDYSIYFTEECNECGICADNCFYDALQKLRKENAT
jgi:Pyruvate/2-oxoacid:ferredoxin oxidoreductase delta subunit